MSQYFKLFTQQELNELVKTRVGETKLGERVVLPGLDNWQNQLQQHKGNFVLIGIPEDIGVRANGGVGGAATAWLPALRSLLNIQSTDKFSGQELLVLGSFHFDEWIEWSYQIDNTALRELVAKLDNEIYPIIQAIVAAGKIPIVIGGGHNNAFPLLKGSSLALGQSINCINLDAHSDYRMMEGRHSGNGFCYAKSEQYLDKYAIVGLHENYNSEAVLADMKADEKISFSFFEDIFLRGEQTYEQALAQAVIHTESAFTGIELDLDCIQNVLSSAHTPSGISALQARQYIHYCAQQTKACYLHLTEGATRLEDGNESSMTGKLIAYLVSDFIKAILSK